MGTASSSIVINLPSPTPSSSSSEQVIDDASRKLSSPSSSEPVMSNAASSPSSLLSSGDPLVDGNVKTVFALILCEDKGDEVERVCDDKDEEACAKAVAALRKCVQAKAALYERYVRDAADDDEKKQQQQEDPTEEESNKIQA